MQVEELYKNFPRRELKNFYGDEEEAINLTSFSPLQQRI